VTETENDNVNNSGDSEAAVDGCADSPTDLNHHTVSYLLTYLLR